MELRPVGHRGLSMRWWLGLTFALVAALTAVAVAGVSTARTESALRKRAQDLAAGSTVAAAGEISAALRLGGDPVRATGVAVASRRLALFVFDASGRLLTSGRSRGVDFGSIPDAARALETALNDRRFLDSSDQGRTIVVGLPLHPYPGAALVSVASRPDLVAEVGLVRQTIVRSALWAALIGAVGGFVVATLIAVRLRRVASVAAEIEGGSFDTRLQPRFHDELGALAATVDRMRARLRESFGLLESERDRLRLLLEQLQEGIIAVDRDLRVEIANGAARRMLAPHSLEPGTPLPELWPEFPLRRLGLALFEAGATVSQGRAQPDPDHMLAVVGIPAGGQTELAVLVLSDVTERERRERAEREFVANAAHELRTPIASIASAIEVLESGAKDLPEDRDRFLAVIDRQTTRLGRLVRALLVLARAQTKEEKPRLEPVELRPLLEEVAAGLDAPEGVTIVVSCPGGLAALAQRDLAEQAVTNLAVNAAKHTRRGSIALDAHALADGSVCIEVRDTGEGILPDVQERIFDRFFSGDRGGREGFGLGLTIVREMVRALGGVVEIDSEPGRGTTARVILARAGPGAV